MPPPPGAEETYSLLVLNVNFRTTSDDLFPLFEKYGKVIDIFIPRDRRTGESRGFAFVRYMYKDEAQKAVERLDGRVVDGREIAVQFAKYGPHAERIQEGRIVENFSGGAGRSRSRSPPRRRYRDEYYGERDYRNEWGRNSQRYERDRYYESGQSYLYSSRSYRSPDYERGRGRSQYDGGPRGRSRSFERDLSPRWARLPGNRSPKGYGLGPH